MQNGGEGGAEAAEQRPAWGAGAFSGLRHPLALSLEGDREGRAEGLPAALGEPPGVPGTAPRSLRVPCVRGSRVDSRRRCEPGLNKEARVPSPAGSAPSRRSHKRCIGAVTPILRLGDPFSFPPPPPHLAGSLSAPSHRSEGPFNQQNGLGFQSSPSSSAATWAAAVSTPPIPTAHARSPEVRAPPPEQRGPGYPAQPRWGVLSPLLSLSPQSR